MKRNPASIPFQGLTYRATDDDLKIFHGYDDDEEGAWLGACYTLTALAGANQSTVDSLVAALSIPLPVGSFIQFAKFAHPDVKEALTNYRVGKYEADDLPKELVERNTNLYQGGVDAPLIEASNVLLNRQDFWLTIKVPASLNPTAKEIEVAQGHATRVTEGISATGISFRQFDVHQLLALLRRLHEPWDLDDESFNPEMPLREQIYGPTEGIDFTQKDVMKFHDGKFFAKALSVKMFLESAALPGMARISGDPGGILNQVTDPYYMVTTIRYPDQVDTTKKVTAKGAIINHQAFGPMLKLSPILAYKKKGFDVLTDEINGRSGVICEVNFTIFLFSRDEKRLNGLASTLTSYYRAMKYKMNEDAMILKALWNELLPLNSSSEGIKNLYRFHTMGVVHACQFLPLLGEWCGTKGAAMMFLTRHGQVATFDIFDSDDNYNGYVCAASGAGKSVLTQGIVRDYLAEGAKVWAIDAGGSYYKLNRAVGGEYIEFSNDSKICLNPFTHVDDLDDEMDVLKATFAKMADPKGDLTAYQVSLLEQAITSVWQKYAHSATPSAVAQFLQEQPNNPDAHRLATQMFAFTDGSYSRWFNGPNNLDMNNPFVLLELQHLKGRKELQQVVLLQIISRINHDMFLTKGRRKIVIIDEAWELLDDPMMEKAMVAIYRKARKAQGSIIVVTQLIGDLARSENSKAIIANSAWSFILKQQPSSVDDAVKSGVIKLDPYAAYLMKSVHTLPGRYSEVMIFRGGTYGVFRNVMDPFTNVLFSTKGAEFETVMDAINRGKPAVEAVNDYMRRRA